LVRTSETSDNDALLHACIEFFQKQIATFNKQGVIMDWRDSAACLTVDPELFFPVGNTGPAVDQIDKAKAVCARCSVTEQCLQYALETNQDSGVWGGLSEDERRALKRRAARARRAS
jgi:WhiB family redox-sensing transcriptional regulator